MAASTGEPRTQNPENPGRLEIYNTQPGTQVELVNPDKTLELEGWKSSWGIKVAGAASTGEPR